MLRSYYVRWLEDKAKANLKGVQKEIQQILLFSQFCSISCSSTSTLGRPSSELMSALLCNNNLVFPSLIQQINARQIFLKYQILL